MHFNEVSKRLYPRIGRNPNFGPIFSGKKCGLSAGKYGIPSDMYSLPRKHIPSDMCSPIWETHIPSDMCSPTWETNIPCDMCFLLIKPIYLVICIPLPGKHISPVICVPLPHKHKFLVICVPQPGKHIEVSLVICFFPLRKHISLVILVL